MGTIIRRRCLLEKTTAKFITRALYALCVHCALTKQFCLHPERPINGNSLRNATPRCYYHYQRDVIHLGGLEQQTWAGSYAKYSLYKTVKVRRDLSGHTEMKLIWLSVKYSAMTRSFIAAMSTYPILRNVSTVGSVKFQVLAQVTGNPFQRPLRSLILALEAQQRTPCQISLPWKMLRWSFRVCMQTSAERSRTVHYVVDVGFEVSAFTFLSPTGSPKMLSDEMLGDYIVHHFFQKGRIW